MVTMIIVSRGCKKQLTIMGWVAHAAGILSMSTSLATDHWLRRVSNGYHVGIFPCCPTFKCGKSVISGSDVNIEAFIDIIIVGMLLVGLGWVLSFTHACVPWRSYKRTLVGLSYIASGCVTVGGITLVAGAIEFVATIPGDMEVALRRECQEQNNSVDTGFSYELFVTGAVAFILAGLLLFLSSCKQPDPTGSCRNGTGMSISEERSRNMPLETVTAHLASHRRTLPLCHSPAASFVNPLYNISMSVNRTAEQPSSERMQRTSTGGHPESAIEIRPPLALPPPYESTREYFSPHDGNPEVGESGHSMTQGHCPISKLSLSLIQPPAYEDILKDQPPPYTDST